MDWTRKELYKLKQGKLHTDDFIIKWKALYFQVKVDNSHAVELLKRNTTPGMITKIFQEGKQKENSIQYLNKIKRVGFARESLNFIMGRTQYRNNYKSLGSKDSNAMDISAIQCGNSGSCFNCRGTGHHATKCRKLKVECPDCHFLGDGHKKKCMQSTPHKKLLYPEGTVVVRRRCPGVLIPLQWLEVCCIMQWRHTLQHENLRK